MTETTSRKSYNQLKQSGNQASLKSRVLEAIDKKPGSTAHEIWLSFFKNEDIQIDAIRPRFAELEKDGLVKSDDCRTCRVTLKTAKVWTPTGPIQLDLGI